MKLLTLLTEKIDIEDVRDELGWAFDNAESEGRDTIRFDRGGISIWVHSSGRITRKKYVDALPSDAKKAVLDFAKKNRMILEASDADAQKERDKIEYERLKGTKLDLAKKQRDLQQQRKSYKKNPVQRSATTGKIADIQKKKSDTTIKMLQKKKEMEKPKMESVNEVYTTNLDPEVEDAILVIAKNERKFYDKRDAKGAIEYAIKEHVKGVIENLNADLRAAKNDLVRQLASYWKREG